LSEWAQICGWQWETPKFWHEVWRGDCPLKIMFNKLFMIYRQQNWAVARVLNGGVINLSFRRNFGNEELLEWEETERELKQVNLTDREDFVRWVLSANGQISTSSLYRLCSFSGVVHVRMEEVWKSMLTLKIKKIIWLVCRGRIQTTDNLKKKRWKGSEMCQFCLEGGISGPFAVQMPVGSVCLGIDQR
jgi:hypothetical protein